MSQHDKRKYQLEYLKKRLLEFIEISKEYSARNVHNKGQLSDQNEKNYLRDKFQYQDNIEFLEIQVCMENPKDVLMPLLSLLQEFVQIFETHDYNILLTSEEKDFISGIKFINNMAKHYKNDFSITDLIYPDFKPETDACYLNSSAILSIPIDQVEFRLGASWVEIDNEISREMYKHKVNKKHHENYKKYLQDYDVIDTIIRAKTIINKGVQQYDPQPRKS